SVIGGREVLCPDAIALEEVYLGLRTQEGLPASSLRAQVREAWIREGWAESIGDRIALTAEGWLRMDELAAAANCKAESRLSMGPVSKYFSSLALRQIN